MSGKRKRSRSRERSDKRRKKRNAPSRPRTRSRTLEPVEPRFPPPPTGAQPLPAGEAPGFMGRGGPPPREPAAQPAQPPAAQPVPPLVVRINQPEFASPRPRAPSHRSRAEAIQAANRQGRDRNEHGPVAPVSQRGILGENVRNLPPDNTESAVHAPASGHRQVIPPSAAASVDQHRRPAPLPLPSGPPSIPHESPAQALRRRRGDVIRETPEQAERRRRAAMAAAEGPRIAREGKEYGTVTREMASLEPASGGETPDPYGSYGATTPDTSVQGDTSVSRSRSRESLLDLTATTDDEGPRRIVRNPSEWEDPTERNLPEPQSPTSESDVDVLDMPDSDIDVLGDSDVRYTGRRAIRGGSGDETPPPRRSGRHRKRPHQWRTAVHATPDQNRPPDYTGATEGASGIPAQSVEDMYAAAGEPTRLPARVAPVVSQDLGRLPPPIGDSPVHVDPRHQRRAEQRRAIQRQPPAPAPPAPAPAPQPEAPIAGGAEPDGPPEEKQQTVETHGHLAERARRSHRRHGITEVLAPQPRFSDAIDPGGDYAKPPYARAEAIDVPPNYYGQPTEAHVVDKSLEIAMDPRVQYWKKTESHTFSETPEGQRMGFSRRARSARRASSGTLSPESRAQRTRYLMEQRSLTRSPDRDLRTYGSPERRSRTRTVSGSRLALARSRSLSEHGSLSPRSDGGLSAVFSRASLSRSRESGEIPSDEDPDIYNPDAEDAFAIPEEDWRPVNLFESLIPEPADEIPEEDAAEQKWQDEDPRVAHAGPISLPPRVPVIRPPKRYARRRVSHRTSVGTAVNRVHGPFRGALSTMPKLSWQHLEPGHYVAKARQGMTPGIRQHVLKLLNRAKGYIWINGKRMSVKHARAAVLKLLATRASVDIKLDSRFPFPR